MISYIRNKKVVFDFDEYNDKDVAAKLDVHVKEHAHEFMYTCISFIRRFEVGGTNYVAANFSDYIEELILLKSIDGTISTSEYDYVEFCIYKEVSRVFYSDVAEFKKIEYVYLFDGLVEDNAIQSTLFSLCSRAVRTSAEKLGISILHEKFQHRKKEYMENDNLVELINSHIAFNPGVPISNDLVEEISRLQSLDKKYSPVIPNSAPLKWAEREKQTELSSASPTNFILSVYKEYLGRGMTTGTLVKLDPTLYRLHNDLDDDQKVPTSLLPNQEEAPFHRPTPSHADLIAQQNEKRAAERERKRAQRAKAKNTSQAVR